MTDNIHYNSDELEAPAWLDKQFVQDALVKHFKEPSLIVTGSEISPATARGDHYASVMFRVQVQYSIQKRKFSKSLIIKTMPEAEGHKKEFLGDSKIFQTEIAMFTQVLPKFQAILREAGEEITFCATCVYHSLHPRKVMIFEDLLPQGYQVIRNRYANTDELRSVLGKLAKWQAVSFKLLKEQPEIFDELQFDFTTMPNILEQDFMTEALPNFIDMISQEENLKEYSKYFEPMRQNLILRWKNVIREYRENRQANAYYVLCHGDFHIRNMMFNKDSDCMLLDFQMSYIGSIANDLQYAKYMLLSPNDRKDGCDALFYFYFDTFVKTLSKIGYQGEMPRLTEFRKQIFDRRYGGKSVVVLYIKLLIFIFFFFLLSPIDIMLFTIFLPGAYSIRKGDDPAKLLQDKNLLKQLYQDKDFKQELEYLLPRMLHLGYFDLHDEQ